MKIFGFRKWFFDVCTSAGEYCFLFISCITVLGKEKIYLQVHGTGELICQAVLDLLEIQGDSIITRQGGITWNDSLITLILTCKNFSVNATWSNFYPSQNSLIPFSIEKRFARLSWKPIFIKSIVNGTIKIDGKNKYTFLNDGGYADKVDSTFFPLLCPSGSLSGEGYIPKNLTWRTQSLLNRGPARKALKSI
jgi:hypothetical protein